MASLQLLMNEIKEALKMGYRLKVDVLRSVVAAVQKASIDRQVEITSELVDEIILKEQKIIKEMIDTCPSERVELLEEYKIRKEIIDFYAPRIIADYADVRSEVEKILTKKGIDPKTANKGQIMKAVMPEIKGKVDMKVANQVVTDLFN